MQSVLSNLDPSVLAKNLASTPLKGNLHKIASVVITCCKFVAERMEIINIKDAQSKIESLANKYTDLRITWVDNKKNQHQLCLLDADGIFYQTGICMTIIKGVFLLWMWNNPQYAMIAMR